MNRSTRSSLRLALACGLACAPHVARAQEVTSMRGFIDAHPDLRGRMLGEAAYRERRYGAALDHFKRSSRYADKASQAMVAEMLWNGTGVPQDRALAYAWMDLAAERGYRDLLVLREQYWSVLSPAERKRAVEVGQTVYAEFGDEVAKPRMDKELLRARTKVTGSHLGRVGSLVIPGSINEHGTTNSSMDVSSFGNVTDGSIYFADKYWVPRLYWQWQGTQWNEGGSGRVTVLPIQPVPPVQAVEPIKH